MIQITDITPVKPTPVTAVTPVDKRPKELKPIVADPKILGLVAAGLVVIFAPVRTVAWTAMMGLFTYDSIRRLAERKKW